MKEDFSVPQMIFQNGGSTCQDALSHLYWSMKKEGV